MKNNNELGCKYYFFPILMILLLSISIITMLFYCSEYNDFKIAYTSWQSSTFLMLNKLGNSILTPYIWKQITLLGDGAVLMLFFSLFLLFKPRIWLSMLASVPVVAILSYIGKKILAMPRPAAILQPDDFTIVGRVLTHNSLPSGHTMTIFADFSVLIIFSYQFFINSSYKNRKVLSIVMPLLLFLLALFMSFSRIAVGAHWQLDIYFGLLLGCISGGIGVVIANKIASNKGNINFYKSKWVIIIIALLSIISLVLFYRFYKHNDIMLLLSAVLGIYTVFRLMSKKIS